MSEHEKKIAYANEIARNLTAEYWPHIALLTDKRLHFIYPMHVYNNFKCLLSLVDEYLNEECTTLINQIDTLLLRYTFWANNNKYIKEDELPSEKHSFLLTPMNSIHNELYAELAPHCFKILHHHLNNNSDNFEHDLTEETENIFSSVKTNIKNSLELGILSPDLVKNICLQSNTIYKILAKQGAT